MVRGATAGPSGSPLAWVRTVQAQHRVRISFSELGKAVPWLTGETVERIAVVQPEQAGIRVVTPAEVERAIAALGGDHADEARLDYAMFLGSRWPIEFRAEKRDYRYSFTLPEGARMHGLLPGAGGKVVVLSWGSIFEVWQEDKWLPRFKARMLTVGQVIDDLEESPP
jgi:hypothetical protein